MKRFIDLHLHSKFSAATSKKMDLRHLSKYGRQKGVDVLGTGDFTHPRWFKSLREHLEQQQNGLYEYRGMYFLPSTEVSTVYQQEGETRKIHHLLLAPTFEIVEQINEVLQEHGNLSEDGRPTLDLTSPTLVETVRDVSEQVEVIPCHIWTPWFSLFGSRSGFDSIDACYRDQSKHIHAYETGLSSDPPMNWRVSELDRLTTVSFSDAHSPWPFRIGREATVLNLEDLSYDAILSTIRQKDTNNLLFTIEFFPEEGKYHLDGHRKCDVRLTPEESKKWNNICPECGKKLTLGVSHRVEELADRPKGFVPKNRIPFKHTIPLQEILGKALEIQTLYSKQIWEIFSKLVARFGSEYNVVFNVKEEELKEVASDRIVNAILQVRNEEVTILPGFDGKYGEIVLFNDEQKIKEEDTFDPKQSSLSDFL